VHPDSSCSLRGILVLADFSDAQRPEQERRGRVPASRRQTQQIVWHGNKDPDNRSTDKRYILATVNLIDGDEIRIKYKFTYSPPSGIHTNVLHGRTDELYARSLVPGSMGSRQRSSRAAASLCLSMVASSARISLKVKLTCHHMRTQNKSEQAKKMHML